MDPTWWDQREYERREFWRALITLITLLSGVAGFVAILIHTDGNGIDPVWAAKQVKHFMDFLAFLDKHFLAFCLLFMFTILQRKWKR